MARKHGCGILLLTDRCQNIGQFPWTEQFPKEPGLFLVQRGWGAPQFPGCFGGAGGVQDPGETRRGAAERENFEELGIRVETDRFPFFIGTMPDRDISYFLGNWWAPRAVQLQPEEMIGYGVFTFAQALNLDLSFLYREAILKYLKQAHP